jgi:hypothetical protein
VGDRSHSSVFSVSVCFEFFFNSPLKLRGLKLGSLGFQPQGGGIRQAQGKRPPEAPPWGGVTPETLNP